MDKRLLILALTLAFAGGVVITRILSPTPEAPEITVPMASDTAPEHRSVARTADWPTSRDVAPERAVNSPASAVRRSEGNFRASSSAPARLAPALPQPVAPDISPRYTLPSQPNTATLARLLEGQPPLGSDERIRVLPVEGTTGSSPGTNGSMLLLLDSSLHDPAVWLEDEKPLGAALAEVKAKIADDFESEVATAAKQPEAVGEAFDSMWKDARAKANWEYQKFFGGEAANRAGLNAGRAAQAKTQ